MGKRVRIIFILVFVSIFSLSNAQEVYQTISYFDDEIKASAFSQDDYGHKILNTLAQTNVKGLNWVYLDFEGRILIQTEQSDDGHIFAYSKLVDYTLAGDNQLREFNIDSLLLPVAISGRLNFFSNGDTAYSVPIEMLLTGGVVNLGNAGIPLDSLSKLNAMIEIKEYIYTQEKYDAFVKTSRLINNYYAYTEVLKLLVDEYTQSGINRKQSSAFVFNSYHEISRVNKYVNTYSFEKLLSLNISDPQGFLKSYAKSLRLEKRAGTIFRQVLETQDKGAINEKQEYCMNYAAISEKYSTLATTFQPYIAAGFIEVMRIFPDDIDKQMIIEAETFYDVFNKLDLASTPQCIYDEFVTLAAAAYEAEKYVEALDYLYNASFVDKQFEQIVNSTVHQEVYIKTLDRLMSAYLQIAIMAYRSGNFSMADNYYQKAHEIYQNNIVNLSKEDISLAMFLNFIEQQVELAYGFLDDNKYYEGLQMVERANSIASSSNLNHDDVLMDSAYAIAYFGIYQQKLDSVGVLIENRNASQALDAMDETKQFTSNKEEYLKNEGDARFTHFAASLFDYYFEQGKRELKGRNPEKALFSFLEAQSINAKYLHREHPEMDSLIYYATVPVILELTRRGEFEVWANRLNEANTLYNEAVSLQTKYKQEENEEISLAISQLKTKLDNQSCVNLGNNIFELKQKVKNRLNTRKYQETFSMIKDAWALIENNPGCDLESDWIIEVEEKYASAIQYFEDKDEVEALLEKGSYVEAIEAYSNQLSLSEVSNLTSLGIDTPDLYSYAKIKKLNAFSSAVSEHYFKNSQYEDALKSLDLMKDGGMSSKDTRVLQESIGKGLAEVDAGLDKKQTVIKYTNGDKWYRYFRSAYLSN